MKILSPLKLLIFVWLALFTAHMPASVFTDWTEYPDDPLSFPFDAVSNTLFDDYYPCTIYDEDLFSGHGGSVLYKMWYQGEDIAGKATIALSYSSDGINWTLQSAAVIDDPDSTVHPSHPVVIYDPNGFGGGPYFYQIWYWTGHASIVSLAPPNLTIKSALSVDGINWTTPVTNTQDTTQFLALTVSTAQPFYQFYGFGTVIYNPDATSTPGEPFSYPYVVFFDSAARESVFLYQEAVGLAYSSDGVNWIRYGTNPVLIPSTNTADWDGMYEYRASVLKLAVDGLYHMYYSGSDGLSNIGLSYAHGIGHAISTDGINWTKDPSNPIFIVTDGVAWRSNHIAAPSVVSTSSSTCSELLQMWFSGGDASNNRRIGFATLSCLLPLPPVFLSMDSNFGPTSGGNTVTILGSGFTGTSSVLFGSTPATSFVINSDTSITATVPPGVGGTIDVTVVTNHGTSSITAAGRYTYLSPSPLPPSHFIGVIKRNKFLNKTECVLETKWDASPSVEVVLYRICKNHKVIKEIAAKSTLVFTTYLPHCSAKGYEITAVDSDDLESSHVKLRIVHD